MYSAMHIVLDIQRGSSQCATLFICATSIYGSWIRETKRIQIRIRISIRIRNSTSTATDLGATGGNSNNCAAIYAIQFVRWPQTLTKFFDLQNYFYDVAGNDFWYHFRQLPSPPPLPRYFPRFPFEVNSNCLRTLYWRTSIRYNRIWPSETTMTTTTATHMFKCIMYECVCVCVCAPLNQLAYLLKIHI